MTRNTWFLFLLVLLLVAAAFTILRPIPTVPESECEVTQGRVQEISTTDTKDIFIQLEGQSTRYYINRGTERGLDAAALKHELVGQTVTLKYPAYWTPLDPANQIRHIAKLERAGETLFSELEK